MRCMFPKIKTLLRVVTECDVMRKNDDLFNLQITWIRYLKQEQLGIEELYRKECNPELDDNVNSQLHNQKV